MKACAFLHTCAIHITLDHSAVARIWGNHKLSGTPDFWRCEVPLLFLLMFISGVVSSNAKTSSSKQCTSPGCQIDWTAKFCVMASFILGPQYGTCFMSVF